MRWSTVVLSFSVAALCTAGCSSGESARKADEHARAKAKPAELEAGQTAFDRAFGDLCYGDQSFELEVTGGRLYTTVTIKDRDGAAQDLRFRVDSGGYAGGLVMRDDVADRLGYERGEDLPAEIVIGGVDFTLPETAKWYVHPSPARELAREVGSRLTRKNYADGQIGPGFLSHYAVCIDPARGRMGLGNADEPASVPGVQALPFLARSENVEDAHYAFVHMKVDGQEHALVLDNGSSVSLLEQFWIERLVNENEDWPVAGGSAGNADMIAGAFSERMIRAKGVELSLPEAALGQRGLGTAPVYELGTAIFVQRPDGWFKERYSNAPFMGRPTGALGNDVLNRWRYVIDFDEEVMFVEETGRTPDVSESMDRVGVAISFDTDGCPRVKRVSEAAAPTTQAQLQRGDMILAINGKNACDMWHHEISAALAGEKGTQKQVLIRRGVEDKSLSLPTARLLEE